MELTLSMVIVGGLGVFFAGVLAYAAKKFAVEEDPRVELVADLLPGANCGACGLAGCSSAAEKIVAGEVPVDSCIPGGKKVADSICEVLGLESVASEGRKVAEIRCLGTKDVAPDKFDYQGVRDCKAAMMYSGGFKACTYGCLGLGTCVEACPFEALSMGANGLPQVDTEKCTGCGVCAKACPRNVIHIELADKKAKYIPCNSKASGKVVRQACEVGCIGCRACVKACPNEAVTVENNLAVINREKCTDCGKCVEACKRGIIKDVGTVLVLK